MQNITSKRNYLKDWLLSNNSIKFFDFVQSIFSSKIKRNVKQIIIKFLVLVQEGWDFRTQFDFFLFEFFSWRPRFKCKIISSNKFKDCLLYTRPTRDIIQIEETEGISSWLVQDVVLYAYVWECLWSTAKLLGRLWDLEAPLEL